jgi:hypothetical protein
MVKSLILMRHGERAAQSTQSSKDGEKKARPYTRSHDRPLSNKGMVTDLPTFILILSIIRKAAISSCRTPVRNLWCHQNFMFSYDYSC